MKTKNIIFPIIAIAIGIFIGYLMFSGSDTIPVDEHKHDHETVENMEEIWTCSMHPQIRRNEPGNCPICGMVLVPLENNGSDNPLVLEMTEEAVKMSNVQTTIVGDEGSFRGFLKLSGKIQPNEENAASLVTHIPGRIEKLYVTFTGEQVYAGQKIASIYSPILISAQKELLEANKMKTTSPRLLEAAIDKLHNWKITDAQIETILNTQEIQESFVIYAHYSGVILNKKVSVGDHLSGGEVLFDIQNLNSLWAIFDVYENDLSSVKVGNQITFTTPSLSGEFFKSKISFIDPVIDPKTRVASIRAEINNSKKKLKPEMFVEGRIEFLNDDDSQNVERLSVPKSAVLWTGERSVVYVKLPNLAIPSFEFREVEIGEYIGDNYLVLSGLNAGEEVVSNGAFVIDASAQLNNQSSMMNRKVVEQNGGAYTEQLPDYIKSTPAEFKNQLESVVGEYVKVKDALVESNAGLAKKASLEMLKVLDDVEMELVKGEAHLFWMKEMKQIMQLGTMISEIEKLDKQRDSFGVLSEVMVDLIKVFGVKDETYYIQFCPMGKEDKGAIWISLGAEIQNPYFGDKMPNCGSVQEIIKIKQD